eukprot:5722256-Amphidinium_carterae.1
MSLVTTTSSSFSYTHTFASQVYYQKMHCSVCTCSTQHITLICAPMDEEEPAYPPPHEFIAPGGVTGNTGF